MTLLKKLTQKHNILAIVFVLLVILILQYPAIFRKSVDSVFGKALILLIVVLLTSYNKLVGLAAALLLVAFSAHLFDMKHVNINLIEGFSPKTVEQSGAPHSSQPAGVETSTDPLIKPVEPVAPSAMIPPLPTTVSKPAGPTQTDLMLSAKEITKSENSKALPINLVKNDNVAPHDPASTSSTLKPAVAQP